MKNSLLLFLILCCQFSFGQITFQKKISSNEGGGFSSVMQTFDGGYILTGGVFDSLSVNNTIGLVKTNSFGDVTWFKTFSRSQFDGGYVVRQTIDGGYVVAGGTNNYNGNIYLIKTDSLGDTLWTKAYNSINSGDFISIKQTYDLGYIICSTSAAYGSGNDNTYLIKTDMNGEIMWAKAYGGHYSETGNGVEQTADSGFYICGGSDSFAGGEAAYLVKTNSNGDLLWSKSYSAAGRNHANAFRKTKDGGCIMTGLVLIDSAETFFLIKTNASGDTLWTKIYLGTNGAWAMDVEESSDGGFVVTGIGFYFIKTDSIGNVLWSKVYGDPPGGSAVSIANTNDGGYALMGGNSIGSVLVKTDANGNSNCNEINIFPTVVTPGMQVYNDSSSVWSGGLVIPSNTAVNSIVGYDSTICLSVGIKNQNPNVSFSISPNPANNQLTLHTTLKAEHAIISIMDVLGQEALSYSLSFGEGRGEALDISKLAAGIYFLQLKTESGSVVKKFVKSTNTN